MTTKTRVNGETTAPSLDELLSFAQESGLTEVVWEKGDRRIAFKRATAPPPPPPPAPTAPPPAAPGAPRAPRVKYPKVGTVQPAARAGGPGRAQDPRCQIPHGGHVPTRRQGSTAPGD